MNETNPIPVEPRRYEIQCPHCPRSFENERGLRTHISQIHPEHSVQKPFVYVSRKRKIFTNIKILKENKIRLMAQRRSEESIDDVLNRLLEKMEEFNEF